MYSYSLLAWINPLRPNDPYSGRTAPLTSKRFILYIYSTNKGTEYFEHDIYSLFFSLKNAVRFIILTYLVPVLFTFYIQSVLKLKKNNSGAKRLKDFRAKHVKFVVRDLILFFFYVVIIILARSSYLDHSISDDFIYSHASWTSERRVCCTLLCGRNIYINL